MPTSRDRYGSVQDLLPLDEIWHDVLCLTGGVYRAVLEVGSVNFALKREAEQEATLSGYRTFLNGLRHPIHMLMRIVPADIEAYLGGLHTTNAVSPALARLALDHEAFVRRLARERTLLDRQFFAVVPAGDAARRPTPALSLPWQRRHQDEAGLARAEAARQLAFRCDELVQGLATFGVAARRLAGEELAQLWYTMLASDLARVQPLPGPSWPVVVTAQPDREEVRHGC